MGTGSQRLEEPKSKPVLNDPATWRSRGDEFKKLAYEETQIVRGTRRDRLLADCEFTDPEFDSIPKGPCCLLPTIEGATVLELRKGPDEHLKVRFEALATQAGMALGCAKDVLPLKFWLFKLFLYLQEAKSCHLHAPSPTGGIITNVYEASANFCFSLERQTLEAEHLALAESSCVQNTAKSTQDVEGESTNATPAPPPEDAKVKDKPSVGFSHSPDYRTVTVRGETYTLTSEQAAMIQILHEAHENGNPDLSIAHILERLEKNASRWQDTFKSNLTAKNALIKSTRKGTLRLNV